MHLLLFDKQKCTLAVMTQDILALIQDFSCRAVLLSSMKGDTEK